MINRGNKDVVFIGTEHKYTLNEMKQKGYARAMTEKGLEPVCYYSSGDIAVNEEYFGFGSKLNISADSGYDYFKTPIGKFRLKVISITKKLHIYKPVRTILRKIRRD